jgi:hypothetical protein
MEEYCFGAAQFHGMQPFQICLWVPQFLRTPQLPNVFGLPQFDVFADSREFFHSDIVVSLTRVQDEGQSS